MKKTWVYIIVALLTVACRPAQPWADVQMWYVSDSLSRQADLFYIVSTNVRASTDGQNEVYNAVLTDEERDAMTREMEFAQTQFGDSLNFYSPYYHQFTMNAILLPADSFAVIFRQAQDDVNAAFDYYIRHLNTNRPFVLAGFSQGAMVIPELLRRMDETTYARCKGAYMAGYQLTQADRQHPHIEPAVSATEGKIISFNTVTRPEARWDFICGEAATCINPVNWCTDTTEAVLYYQRDTLHLHVDTVHHVLICDADETRYCQPDMTAWYPIGCLHLWDLLFYPRVIHANMMKRIN